MTRHEQDVEMTARLYDCRSAARGILGANYHETLKPWRALIGRVMGAKRMSTLQAVLDIGLHIDPADGIPLMMVMAAGVEMMESATPSDARPTDSNPGKPTGSASHSFVVRAFWEVSAMSDTPKTTKVFSRYSSPCPVRATGSTRSPHVKGSQR